jgi:F-type H+-transporting ATPase subunit beta
LHDEFKDYPERALYMIGNIGEAVERKKAEPKPKSKPEPEAAHATSTHES